MIRFYRLNESLSRFLGNGKYTGHTAPDQIDPQHGADHQGDADGGRVEDAQGAAACAGRRPYAALMNRVLVSLQQRTDPKLHPLLQVRPVKKELVLIISTDKGLAGALNTNLLREAANFDADKTDLCRRPVERRGSLSPGRSAKMLADFELKDAPVFHRDEGDRANSASRNF